MVEILESHSSKFGEIGNNRDSISVQSLKPEIKLKETLKVGFARMN